MKYIILILILFIFINTALKLSYWKWWQAAIFGLICAGFVLLSYPFAITQSKTQLTGYLSNTQIMQDIAVLVTFESAIYLAYCFSAMRELYGRDVKRWIKPLKWYPGLLVFPALLYVLIKAVFSFSGTDFATIAYVIAGIVFIAFPLLNIVIKWFLPEKELRLEIQFLVSLFVAVIGLVCTVNGNVTYSAVSEPLNIKGLALATGLFVVFFAIGYCWNKYKWKFKRNNN